MARALARGWGERVLATDGGSGRAAALVDELGGEALGSNAELAERADLVLLACKPYQLETIAGEMAGKARRGAVRARGGPGGPVGPGPPPGGPGGAPPHTP